jgi:hypothetical protein
MMVNVLLKRALCRVYDTLQTLLTSIVYNNYILSVLYVCITESVHYIPYMVYHRYYLMPLPGSPACRLVQRSLVPHDVME